MKWLVSDLNFQMQGLYRHRAHRRKEYGRNGQKISSTEPKPIQRGGGQICRTLIQKVAARVSDDDDGSQVQDDPVRASLLKLRKLTTRQSWQSKYEDEMIRFWKQKKNFFGTKKNEEKK